MGPHWSTTAFSGQRGGEKRVWTWPQSVSAARAGRKERREGPLMGLEGGEWGWPVRRRRGQRKAAE